MFTRVVFSTFFNGPVHRKGGGLFPVSTIMPSAKFACAAAVTAAAVVAAIHAIYANRQNKRSQREDNNM